MPSYRYTARDERGNAVNGTLAAPTSEAMAEQLKRMGYLVTRSRELTQGAAGGDDVLAALQRVSYDDLVLFNVQLATMVQVGIPLVTALTTLAQQTGKARLQRAISDVAMAVESGSSFSEALGRQPKIFSRFFVSMVRSGEVSGRLDEILRRLALFAKRQAELRQQLTTAMTYPAVLIAVGVGVMGFLVMGIIPKFMKIFVEAGVPLPLPTQLLYEASQLLRRFWPVFLALLGFGVFALRTLLRTRVGRRSADALVLRLPVIGDLVRQVSLSRMARTLETLFSSGVPVLESLAIAEDTCGNTVIAEVCQAAQTSVRQGGTIAEPLRSSAQVPPMMVQMVAAGEASGTTDRMLREIADHYDERIQHGVKRVTTLIEPAFLLVVGGMVALIMASILLPMFRMVNVIH